VSACRGMSNPKRPHMPGTLGENRRQG